MTRAVSPAKFITLMLITGLSVLSLNMFLPSLANIAVDFNADYSLVSLSVAGYLGMTALVQIIVGPLSDRFGRRPVLLIGLSIYIFASLGCSLSTEIEPFLAFRMLQAAVISGAALSPAIVRDLLPQKEAASLIAYVGMAMAIAPMLGPMLGGVLDEFYGWRSSFFAYFAIGVIALLLCFFNLQETHNKRSSTFAHQLAMYPSLLGSKRLWGYAVCLTFSIGAFYSFLAGVPLIATAKFGLSAGELGFYIGTITAGFFLGSMISGRFNRYFELTSMIIAGRLCACTGLSVGLICFASGLTHIAIFFSATICVGIGNGLTIPGANVGAMSVKPELSGSTASFTGAMTVAGGSLLTTFIGATITQENGIYLLLGTMLICSLIGLLASLFLRHWERQNTGEV